MKVAVGLSGGVDSAVTALLLKDAGHEVYGVSHLHYHESRCCDAQTFQGAKELAARMGIPYRIINVISSFRREVFDAYLSGYQQGVTLNPCTLCNARIRFDELLDEVEYELGVDKIATGHYARVQPSAGRWQLLKGVDPDKDQSYMLYRLRQEQLAKILLPLGHLTKPQVRELAHAWQLPMAATPDSQDICFVKEGHQAFIRQHLGDRPGDIVDQAGRKLGEHLGVAHYTIGQRRGLGISVPEPHYVVGLDAATNTVVVGPRDAGSTDRLVAGDFNWVSDAPWTRPGRAQVKIRYRSQAASALLEPLPDGRVLVVFDEPQWAVTPGQAAVAYDGERVIGGGVIGSC